MGTFLFPMQARDANAGIKAKLVYRDEEELDTGVQKVQPLPFLGVYVLMWWSCDGHAFNV